LYFSLVEQQADIVFDLCKKVYLLSRFAADDCCALMQKTAEDIPESFWPILAAAFACGGVDDHV
jgi:hypothetical protein